MQEQPPVEHRGHLLTRRTVRHATPTITVRRADRPGVRIPGRPGTLAGHPATPALPSRTPAVTGASRPRRRERNPTAAETSGRSGVAGYRRTSSTNQRRSERQHGGHLAGLNAHFAAHRFGNAT
ncbi:hypothetical protein, partial [Micromonospora sp. ATA51]|uniref:hypothetical protein n=1 Tax=Micromonospora sp. ATA51 TaxID=2806098 RepID=UPI001A420AF9